MDAQHQHHEDARARARDAHTHDAHVHEEAGAWTSPLGIDEDFIRRFFEEWKAAEEQIASYNNVKKAMLSKTRSLYGSYHTEALKRACNMALKDPAQVAKDAVLDKAARDYLKILWDRP